MFPNLKQYCLFRLIPKGDRTDKVPIGLNGQKINHLDPANLLDFTTASVAKSAGIGHGIGFVFFKDDPFFFLDIDHAVIDGQWSQRAVDLCRYFQGCYIEQSQSREGLHIIGTAPLALPHSCEDTKHKLGGFYTESRFVALTGYEATGSFYHTPDAGIYRWLIDSYFPPKATTDLDHWTTEPVEAWRGPEDDDELIRRMLASKKSLFSRSVAVQALWNADADELGRAYPDEKREFDHNRADAALCQHLAFWTGGNCERIDALFRRSDLYREKWEREDYRQNTIMREVGRCKNFYREAGADRDEAGGSVTAGVQFKSIYDQQGHFNGCVYVEDQHCAFTPNGRLLPPDRFRVMYGGYTFALDAQNNKVTKSAWEAFTESQGLAWPKVHTTCFRPELPPGSVFTEEGWSKVNDYVPIENPGRVGDPAPFLDLLSRMLPAKHDRDIALAYCAALVQYPGVKFQWAPLFQGVQGNGKSLIIRAISKAVGMRYSHFPNALDLANKFNEWLINKLFIGVQEIRAGNNPDIIETLKEMICGEFIDIQGKRKTQEIKDNRANFILNTNHKDGLRITLADRRYCVFFTAQQTKEDLQRYGMGGEYFPRLYAWFKADGCAIINNFLRTYVIPDELNPATRCHRAPETTTTQEAIQYGLGMVEQEIQEAIGQGRSGFCGGWISSLALDQLLQDRRIKLAPNKRKEVLENLGYAYHPGLKNGRVNSTISDGGVTGKPRLYIPHGHILGNITSPSEIASRYVADQSAANNVFVNERSESI